MATTHVGVQLQIIIIVQSLVHWIWWYCANKCCCEEGAIVQYPGLESHEQHHIIEKLRNKDYGYGGILTLDLGSQKVTFIPYV